ASLWIAFAGAVALLGILVGVIVLVGNNGGGDSRQGPALARGDTRVVKTDRGRFLPTAWGPGPEPTEPTPEGPGADPTNPTERATAPDPTTPTQRGPAPAPPKPRPPVGEIRRFVGPSGLAFSVAFAPNGQTAVSGGYDKTVRLWDVESGQEIHRFEGH